ncbi:hypothetical protein CDL12_11369 [Handroanthus impetiginosus]|uniref:SREBP regulating gene protein n=1 Tax=Handroanthus impetiginosus TaxID=429701 RepID=A0A2G9HER5_9LAMI|nr:hypothetical protein CDL12_11369 [Handroanthus impetiginosus]
MSFRSPHKAKTPMFPFQNPLNINPILLLVILHFSPPVSAIRKDVSLQLKQYCRTTVQGRFFLTDDNGNVCDAFSVDPLSRCCPEKGDQFSCQGCNLFSQCCNSYEFCVSCCLNPAMVHENAYLSEFHHCFSMPSNYSGSSSTQLEARLAGINIITGRQGESCDSVCKSSGQSCVPNKLALLNQCEVIQKYMSCKGACLESIGADQPAEVVDDAPRHLNPGACLYTKTETMLSCDGSHRHTRRLCPCA